MAAEAEFQKVGLLDDTPQSAAGLRVVQALLQADNIDSDQWNRLVPSPHVSPLKPFGCTPFFNLSCTSGCMTLRVKLLNFLQFDLLQGATGRFAKSGKKCSECSYVKIVNGECRIRRSFCATMCLPGGTETAKLFSRTEVLLYSQGRSLEQHAIDFSGPWTA